MLVRATGARSIVEFGTSFGISTLHLAAGLRDNGGGRVITTEFESSKAARARANFVAGGLADLIELREGDAVETLEHDLPTQIDLVLLDGAKGLYPTVLTLLEEHLKPGAMIVADNADRSPEYLQRVRSSDRRVSVGAVRGRRRTVDAHLLGALGHEYGPFAGPVCAGPGLLQSDSALGLAFRPIAPALI